MCTHSRLPRSGHCRAAQNQLFCKSRKRNSPCLSPTAQFPLALLQKLLQRIKGPSDLLLGLPVTPLYWRQTLLCGPSHRQRSGLISLVGMQLDDGAALSSKSWPLPLPGAQLHGPTAPRAEEAQPAPHTQQSLPTSGVGCAGSTLSRICSWNPAYKEDSAISPNLFHTCGARSTPGSGVAVGCRWGRTHTCALTRTHTLTLLHALHTHILTFIWVLCYVFI